MKLLVIGIDGGDTRVFDALECKTINSLLETGNTLKVTEDLWSRGWAEIISGLHARETGAFYEHPKVDGTTGFTQSASITRMEDELSMPPLWTIAQNLNKKIGFMNVPGTMPAPKNVNGFFVSGAGAGMGDTKGTFPNGSFEPLSVKKSLEKNSYLYDLRVVFSGVQEPLELAERLQNMIKKRTNTYLDLCSKSEIDFGFIAYMGQQRIQNLAMSEIMALKEAGGYDAVKKAGNLTEMQRGIKRVFSELDESVERLVSTLKPDAVMLVSDHGGAPYLNKVNVNEFLRKAGFQESRKLRATLKNIAKKIVPRKYKRKVGGALSSVSYSVANDVNWSKTKAFGHRFVSGIFIYDDRFGGDVIEGVKRSELIQDIIIEFNNSLEAQQHKMKAGVYRSEHLGEKFQEKLPDIWIDAPETMFFENSGPFCMKNINYGPVNDLSVVLRDTHTGIKGKQPLLCINSEKYCIKSENKFGDLREAYNAIEKILKA